MGIFGKRKDQKEEKRIERDDLYSLNREGQKINPSNVNGRTGRLDRPHVFEDGKGEIIPASKLRSGDSGIDRIKGRTLKHGPEHSHDPDHEYHQLEDMPNPPTDLLGRFRRVNQEHRTSRKESRDR